MVTLLVPFVMQTLVELLLGTPVGFQCEALFQLLLPSFHVDTVPVSVHWPKAAEQKQTNTKVVTVAARTKPANKDRATFPQNCVVPIDPSL
jgi:hypothetical protein